MCIAYTFTRIHPRFFHIFLFFCHLGPVKHLYTAIIFLIMTCYQLHATFFGSKRCPRGNTQAHPQTVQTVHLNEGRTPFCTVSSQKINKQTNTVSRSSSSQTMLEGVCGCFMPCNIFLAGNSEVSLVLHCFTAELITYIVCECDAPECGPLLPC